jgi:hypothetical protein
MSLPLKVSKGSSISLALVFCFTTVASLAHKVEVAGDVAGNWHIEPNHNPQVGKPARAWIALTRKGGTLLPLSQASCQLAVYLQPRKADAQPILKPTLKAISAEQYQGIPGADVTFPKIGRYVLELNCKPKVNGNFQPFRMQYEVTVAR